MIDSKKMKQIVAHIHRRDRGIRDTELMYPMREWLTGILLTLVVVALGGLVSYLYYIDVYHASEEVVTPAVPAIPYDAARVDAAIDRYEARLEVYEDIRGNSAPSVVPIATTTQEAAIPASDENETETSTSEIEVEVGTPDLAR